ncbi:MAG: Hpt domain-containing protein, partial [Cyanophyceae cyanobacterium]
MRATHTLKGASANVGLGTIQTIAHHMEDVFRTLFDPDATVDVELEALLFESYECLRLALTGEIVGNHDRDEEIIATAVGVFAKIQEQLG